MDPNRCPRGPFRHFKMGLEVALMIHAMLWLMDDYQLIKYEPSKVLPALVDVLA